MNIKDVADISRLPAKTIRYYEDIGLVRPERAQNGYRRFAPRDLHKLTFIGRARGLGFTVEDCRALLSLYDDKSRASAEVRRVARDHLLRVETKIAELESIRRTLRELVESRHGDHRPDCPILDDLAGGHDVGNSQRRLQPPCKRPAPPSGFGPNQGALPRSGISISDSPLRPRDT
jgi:Cu(I)-responsive transcriptional regulator